MCNFRVPAVLQEKLHCLQQKGFSPLCTAMWLFRLAGWAQEKLHCLQLKDFSTLWESLWFFRWLAVVQVVRLIESKSLIFCHNPLPPSPHPLPFILHPCQRLWRIYKKKFHHGGFIFPIFLLPLVGEKSFIMEVSFLQFPYFRWLGSSRIKEANYLEESPSVIFRGKQNCSNNIQIQGTRSKV